MSRVSFPQSPPGDPAPFHCDSAIWQLINEIKSTKSKLFAIRLVQYTVHIITIIH